jgi:uncharacterized protein
MFIAIEDLERHPIDFREELAPGALDLEPEAKQIAPLKTSGRAQLVQEHHSKRHVINDIRIAGELSTSLELTCARCLEPVTEKVARSFDLLYRPQGTDAGKEEQSVTTSEAEVSYYHGEGLQLEEVIREQVLLAIPLRAVCREDCKGLCPQCGKNLNQEKCSCTVRIEDPRWSGLKDLRSKLQHN